MLFGLFSKASKLDVDVSFGSGFKGALKEFLLTSDEKYHETFRKNDMKFIASITSRDLYMKIYRTLAHDRPWSTIGNSFKHTKWTIQSSNDNEVVCYKYVKFDKVKLSRQLSCRVSEDYAEIWYIVDQPRNNGYIINNIEVCQL